MNSLKSKGLRLVVAVAVVLAIGIWLVQRGKRAPGESAPVRGPEPANKIPTDSNLVSTAPATVGLAAKLQSAREALAGAVDKTNSRDQLAELRQALATASPSETVAAIR